jgi:multicomponent Na+:H+ antiporter subunit A
MLPLAVLSPFLLMPVAVWLGKQRARWAVLLAIFPACLALYFGNLNVQVAASGPLKTSLPWAGSLELDLSFYADGLSVLFALLITGIGSLIVIFGSRYFDGDPRAGRFQATLFAFMGSMLGVVLADNLVLLYAFWELTGFTSYLLIGFDHERTESRSSAMQALIVTGAGGLALLAAALLVEQESGILNLSALLSGSVTLAATGSYPFIVVLLLLAAFTKSAQTPFHFWLPNAMTAPTPVSAYLHSATMVKAGLYLVARMTPIAGGAPLWIGLVTGAGAITMTLGAWRALAETDLKRVLAYSTVSALGVLMMLLGLGTETAVTAALVYLLAHACYKGALFLVAGTLEHETGTRDVTELSGLRHTMPVTALAGALAACSMAGLPLFLGFVGKELLYGTLFNHGEAWTQVLLAMAVGASALLGAAGFIAGVAPFAGQPGAAVAKHAVPTALAFPPLILGILGFAAGLWPGAIDTLVGLAVSGVTRTTPDVHLALWHGLTLVLGLSLLTLALVALLYRWRGEIRLRIWPRSLGFERLYTSSMQTLHRVSEWSLPMLQGASLRSYVLALIVTAAVLMAAVLLTQGLPYWPTVIDVRPSEFAAAMLIVGGAITAVRARSTITAVLSLGVTGYGVALTFLLFGAPDLAMTQFSVETLTVIIYTLVFYHFRRFRSLSVRSVRIRDFLVAVLFGGSIAFVLLFVGASTTPFRLGGYFAEMSVPLAHGRNIVNVILVDFRAFDTLGEITVLATAALGVRAVLQLGRQGERNQ